MPPYFSWQMVRDGGGFHFRCVEGPLPELGEGEALVEVAGCGVCGTDLSYFYGDVPTVSEPPLTLGHEVSGRVVRGGGPALDDRPVVVPTVIPCRKCELCRSGRANRCLRQRMLGGNFSARGGFASHVAVPAAELTVIPEDCPLPLERLAVVADAVSTPYQAVLRAGVGRGDKIVVIGATGGLGVYLVQWAKRLGAEIVVGLARDAAKLAGLEAYGLDLGLAVAGDGSDIEAVRHDIWAACRKRGINPRAGWKIFEASGTLSGQKAGLELLTFASRLILVGYAPGEMTHHLSKIMAYDAEIIGSWGCDPRHYGEVIHHIGAGGVQILPFTELRPMSRIAETFEELRAAPRSTLRRIILTTEKAVSSRSPEEANCQDQSMSAGGGMPVQRKGGPS